MVTVTAVAAAVSATDIEGASFLALVEPDDTTLGVPRVAPPRAAGFAVPLAGGGAELGVRALDNEAAVGLLRRSATALLNVVFFVGVGGGGTAVLAFAKDAAVGAKRPDGVFGRIAEVGDLVRDVELGVRRDGVFERVGVAGGFAAGFRCDDPVCWGFNG